MASRRSYPKTLDPLDQWLDAQGLYRKHTARDGSCLFRAISEQVFHTQARHLEVRKQCVAYLRKERTHFQELVEGPYEEYLEKMENPKVWGGSVEIKVMSLLYSRDILVYKEVGKLPLSAISNDFEEKIYLTLTMDYQYDCVYSKQYVADSAFIQSMTYNLLYQNVFKVQDIDYAIYKMLYDRGNRFRQEYQSTPFYHKRLNYYPRNVTNSDDCDDGNLNIRELLANGQTPFPYKVAKALDPETYRNVEFDLWNDHRKELRMGLVMGNGELQVGVRCLVRFELDTLCHAYIQDMAPDKGPVEIFVEEHGERCTVPYDALEILIKSNSKPQQSEGPMKHPNHMHNNQKLNGASSKDLGGKWKKSKAGKPRKIKENVLNESLPVSPRFQFKSTRIGSGSAKHNYQNNNRYMRGQSSSPEGQHNFPRFQAPHFNSLQTFFADDLETLSLILSSEQRIDGATLMNGGTGQLQMMRVPSPPHPEADGNNHPSSPMPQPNSTTPQHGLPMPEAQTSEANIASSPQYATYTGYSDFGLPRPANFVPGPSLVSGSAPPYPYTHTVPPYVMHEGGANIAATGNRGGFDQAVQGSNENFVFQPVNVMAARSTHQSGNDVPLSDRPTLRYYYNLGHDYLHTNYGMWPQRSYPPNFIHPPTGGMLHGPQNNIRKMTNVTNEGQENEVVTPDSTTSLGDNLECQKNRNDMVNEDDVGECDANNCSSGTAVSCDTTNNHESGMEGQTWQVEAGVSQGIQVASELNVEEEKASPIEGPDSTDIHQQYPEQPTTNLAPDDPGVCSARVTYDSPPTTCSSYGVPICPPVVQCAYPPQHYGQAMGTYYYSMEPNPPFMPYYSSYPAFVPQERRDSPPEVSSQVYESVEGSCIPPYPVYSVPPQFVYHAPPNIYANGQQSSMGQWVPTPSGHPHYVCSPMYSSAN